MQLYIYIHNLYSNQFLIFRSTQTKKEKIEQIAQKLDVKEIQQKFRDARNETIGTLREISKHFNNPIAEKLDLFYDYSQPDPDSLCIDEENLKYYKNLDPTWIELLKKLKRQLEREKELESELRSDLDELEFLHHGVFNDKRPYNKYLLGYGIAYESLTLTGMNEFGLTVQIRSNIQCGSLFLSIEHGLHPNLFADALQEEQDLLCFSLLERQPTIEELTNMNLLCQKALQREFEKYVIINMKVVEMFREMALALHGSKKSVHVAKTVGSFVSIFGGVAFGVGLITAGAATPFVVFGGALVAAIGGIVNVGADMGDAKKEQNILNEKCVTNDKMLLKSIANLAELLEHVLKSLGRIDINPQKTVSYGGVGVKVVQIATVGLAGGLKCVSTAGAPKLLQLLKAPLGFGAVGVGIAFDLLSVIDNSVALAKESKSQLGYKLAIDAEELEKDLMEKKSLIEQSLNHLMRATDAGDFLIFFIFYFHLLWNIGYDHFIIFICYILRFMVKSEFE